MSVAITGRQVMRREIRRQVRLPAGLNVDQCDHQVTFDGHLLVALLLGDADATCCPVVLLSVVMPVVSVVLFLETTSGRSRSGLATTILLTPQLVCHSVV